MADRLDEPIGGKRICYSCGNSYPDVVRFCPKDSTDLEYFPQSVDAISNSFRHHTRWKAVVAISALLLIVAGFTVDRLTSASSANTVTRGELMVRTTPEGARVYLDGAQVGLSPVRLNIRAGVHEVRAVFPGYSEGQAKVEIIPSATQRLVWDLSPLPSRNKLKDRKKFMASLSPAKPSAVSAPASL